MGGFSQVDGPKTWTVKDRQYVLHTITLPGSDNAPEVSISCLLEPRLIPLLPSPLPHAVPPNTDPCFRIEHTPHKGMGMFAARDIAPGELVVVEHPALILPAGDFTTEAYDALGEGLPEPRRSALLAMGNCRPLSECPSPVEGIVHTNAMMLELNPKAVLGAPPIDGVVYGGVYPLINRSNHSCGPNAAIKWNRAALTLTMYALRAIPAGAEIHKTYLDPALPRAERTAHLLKNYRFACDCPWCTIPSTEPALIAASDARRAALGRWIFTHLRYKKWSRDLARADDVVIGEHLEALELIRLEGMEGLQNLFVEEIAMCYAMLGDLDEFVRWGTMTVQLSRIEDPPVAARFEDWLLDPPKRMKHWAWRKKQRQQQSGKKRVEESTESLNLDSFGKPDDKTNHFGVTIQRS